MPELEDYIIFEDDEEVGAEADINNLDTTIQVSPIPTTRIHKNHPLDQVIGDLQLATQTRRMSKNFGANGKNQKGNSCIKGSKLDRGYAGRASTIQATRSLDFGGFIKWKKMSSMGELTFFLGLQVQQKKDGIFISQDKYVDEILKKFGFTEVKTASTPMETQKPLLKDEDGEEVDVHMYRSMIGSLMYLTSSRPDIMFVVCVCARYQVNPKVSHLHAVKRIFRYLKGQPKLGLWYPKDSPFDLVAYTDSDYAGASLDRKSTTGGKSKKSVRLMMEELCKNRQSDLVRKRIKRSGELKNRTRVKYIKNRQSVWNGIGVNIGDSKLMLLGINLLLLVKVNVDRHKLTTAGENEAVYKELDDSLVRAATTASSLEAEQDSGNINKTRSKATPNEAGSKELLQVVVPGAKTPWGIQLLKLGLRILKLNEMMELSTNLQQRVLDLEETKTTQAKEIISLKRRFKKLKQKKRSRTHGLKRLYKVGLTARVESSKDEDLGEDASKQGRNIHDIDADEDITLVGHDDEMFDVDTLTGDEVFPEQEVAATINVDEVTLAHTLMEIKRTKPKVKGIVIQEPSTTTTTISSKQSQDKGKGIMVELEKTMKKKDQISADEETAKRLQAEFDEEERLARETDEANVALIEEWDDIQAKIEADYQLA
ncbi:uncharacterized mitochondrial protein-like protein [Tanacetum coccineum]